MKKYLTGLCLALSLTLTACQQTSEQPAPVKAAEPPKPVATESNHGIVPINALAHAELDVATTTEQKQLGLLHHPTIATNAGMVFVFDQPTPACFWMKNTLIPLSIGFIDEQGILVQVEDMAPNTLTTHCAKTAIKYAIEMNKGWYAKNKANIGMPLLETQKP